MLLMNGALTQHQCCCCHKSLHNVNKVLAVNREKKSVKTKSSITYFKRVEGVLEDKLSKFFFDINDLF